MNKELLEAASRLVGIVLDEMAFPEDIKEPIRRMVERFVEELQRVPGSAEPPGPSTVQDLAAQLQRATVNISGIALLVQRMGADTVHVRDLIYGHLLAQAAGEQDVVRALLTLPRAAQGPREGLH